MVCRLKVFVFRLFVSRLRCYDVPTDEVGFFLCDAVFYFFPVDEFGFSVACDGVGDSLEGAFVDVLCHECGG